MKKILRDITIKGMPVIANAINSCVEIKNFTEECAMLLVKMRDQMEDTNSYEDTASIQILTTFYNIEILLEGVIQDICTSMKGITINDNVISKENTH